ncbi:FtsX-like permease family protein [Aeromicrobium sp. REDSEA-S38_B2]|jgi:hypothetical protein|uniref:FtsX-like permease family protein n=1 Tax=Aeromicrobium sp. REDSEA-S38_B2 TaxID=1811528 RepID=UPI000AAD883C|nr:FtsX-like permease family protein [Aeromicrobium sp. REDSEA-S38_B2]
MRSVVPALLRAGAGSRALVVVAATAVATAVLMAAASIAMLWFERIPSDLVIDARGYGTDLESVNWIVADPGTRGGVLFGAIVLVLPPLLLLDQAVRLGAASRQRRDAALRLAGATRRDVRALAALEVALPALVGGVLGIPTFLLLRSLLAGPGFLAPTSFPPLWVVPLVLVGVALVGAGVGARAGKDDPLGTARRVDLRSGLSWRGPAALGVGAVLLVTQLGAGYGSDVYLLLTFVALGLIVLGLVGSAPWVAYGVARRVVRRARTAPDLLAAQRVLVAPGAAGRAAAGVGAIGLALGTTAVFSGDVMAMGQWEADGTYDIGAVATAVAALVALAVLAGSLAVHAVESIWESRREIAFLAATGTTQVDLDRALLRQVRLVAVPLGVTGATIGALGYSGLLLVGESLGGTRLVAVVVGILGTWACVSLAAWAAARLVRPVAVDAARPLHLRTE